MRKCFAAILFSACSLAQAFTLDFNTLPEGQSPGEAYASYGVHISGGTVQDGKVAGAFTMTFDPGFDVLRLDYEYAKLNEGFSYVYSTRWGLDAMYRDPTINPYCYSQASCDAKGMIYIPDDKLFIDHFTFEQGAGVYRITLGNAWTDNLKFTMAEAGGAGASVITGEVPEPSGAILFLAGFLMLAGWRGQRQFQLRQQGA